VTMTVTEAPRTWHWQQGADAEEVSIDSTILPQTLTFSDAPVVVQPMSSPFPQRSDLEVEQIFNTLSALWLRETKIESDPERIVFHPAYQRIIGLGPQVLPFILRDLKQYHHHWFWALTALTGEDPAEGQITVGGAAEAWLAWGRNHRLADG
jgi:hypothetical protein